MAYSYTYPLNCPIGTSLTPPPTCNAGLPTTIPGGTWVCGSSTTTTTSSITTTTVCPPYLFYATPNSLSFTATQGGALPASQSLSLNFSNGSPPFLQWSILSAPAWLSVTPTSGYGPRVLTVSIPSTQIAAGVYPGIIRFSSSTLGCLGTSNYATVTFTVEPTVTTSTSTTTTVATTTTTTLCNAYVNGTTQYKYSGSGSCHSFALDLVTGAHIVRDQKYCRQHMTHFNSSGNHVHAYPHPACM